MWNLEFIKVAGSSSQTANVKQFTIEFLEEMLHCEAFAIDCMRKKYFYNVVIPKNLSISIFLVFIIFFVCFLTLKLTLASVVNWNCLVCLILILRWEYFVLFYLFFVGCVQDTSKDDTTCGLETMFYEISHLLLKYDDDIETLRWKN